MPYCVECGESVDEGYMFCPNCGHDVGRDDDSGADEPPAEPTAGDDERAAENDPDTWGSSNRPGQSTDSQANAGQSSHQQTTDAHATSTGSGASGTVPRADAEPARVPTDPDGPSPFSGNGFSFGAGYATKNGWNAIFLGGLVLFGAIFVPFGMFFLPFIVLGYGFQLTRSAALGRTEPPEFDGYGDMIIDGYRVFAVAFVYFVVWFVGTMIASGIGEAVHPLVGSVLSLLVVVLVAYGFNASVTAYAAHGSITAAFSPTYAGAFATTETYLKAFGVWFVAYVAVNIVTTISAFTIIGIFVAIPWGTYFVSSLWGYYYREAVEAEPDVPAASADPT